MLSNNYIGKNTSFHGSKLLTKKEAVAASAASTPAVIIQKFNRQFNPQTVKLNMYKMLISFTTKQIINLFNICFAGNQFNLFKKQR